MYCKKTMRWEESEKAWELGEAEAMIVGTVHQEVGYSWQDACDTWAAQDGETEAGVHQVGVSGAETGQKEEDQCKEIKGADQGGEQPEAGGLLVEGEERETPKEDQKEREKNRETEWRER